MKAWKKSILCGLLTVATVLACGCTGGKEDDASSASVEHEATNSLLTNPVILLNDFETQTELSTLTMTGTLGKVNLNDDKTYVTKGEKSAKVTVIHNPWSQGDDQGLYQGTDLVVRDEDFSDFAKTKRITLDVYNANDTAEKIGLQLVYPTGSTLVEWFSLPANGWHTVEYTVARESIPVVGDNGVEKNKVKGINIMYERPVGKDTVFYMDNLCLYNATTEVEPLVRTLKTDEIASFDSWWQVAGLTLTGGNYAPQTHWVKERSRDGSPLLKLECIPGGSTWPTLRIGAEHCAMIDWASYSGEDTLKIDIYMPEGQAMEVAVTIYGLGIPIFQELQWLEAGKWNELSFTVDYINNNPYDGATRKFDTTMGITIGYREFSGTENRQLYIDNIRMERATEA